MRMSFFTASSVSEDVSPLVQLIDLYGVYGMDPRENGLVRMAAKARLMKACEEPAFLASHARSFHALLNRKYDEAMQASFVAGTIAETLASAATLEEVTVIRSAVVDLCAALGVPVDTSRDRFMVTHKPGARPS